MRRDWVKNSGSEACLPRDVFHCHLVQTPEGGAGLTGENQGRYKSEFADVPIPQAPLNIANIRQSQKGHLLSLELTA